jgi:fatty acid-binding protein DegV
MTRIIADTTCGLDPAAARQLGIPLISQIINFGAESFREGVDMDHAAFMARLKAGRELPKTAAPYPGDFIEAFTELMQHDESVVWVISSRRLPS